MAHQIKVFFLLLTSITLLACSTEKTVYGVIDDNLLITDQEIHEMGIDEFKKNYEGKEVTVTDLRMLDRAGVFNRGGAQCKIGYTNNKKEDKILVSLFTNFIPPSAINRSKNFDHEKYTYSKEIALPKSICDPCIKHSAYDLCKNQPNKTSLTGKIIRIKEKNNRIYMDMKIKGMSY